jgi:NitT/TauT family transport system permease protein
MATLAACILLWQMVITIFRIPDYLLPTPISVLNMMVERFDFLMFHTWITTVETILGFLLSIVVGIPLAISIVSARWVEQSVYPLLVLSQAVPKIAFAPLMLVWIGFGLETKIFVAVLVAFFPIVISTVAGFKSIPEDMIHLGRSTGLSPLGMFVKIRIPHALPSLFAGLKVAITLAVVGAVVGEFVGADRGLGYLLLLSSGRLNLPLMFACIVLLAALGVIFFAVVEVLERQVLPWHISVRGVHASA